MKKFLQLKTRTYKSKEYDAYLRSQIDDEDYDESDAWKKDIKEDVDLPTSFESQVRLDPNQIVMYIETASLEAYTANPDHPKNDCLDVYLQDGLMITVIGTIKSLEKQIAELNS